MWPLECALSVSFVPKTHLLRDDLSHQNHVSVYMLCISASFCRSQGESLRWERMRRTNDCWRRTLIAVCVHHLLECHCCSIYCWCEWQLLILYPMVWRVSHRLHAALTSLSAFRVEVEAEMCVFVEGHGVSWTLEGAEFFASALVLIVSSTWVSILPTVMWVEALNTSKASCQGKAIRISNQINAKKIHRVHHLDPLLEVI